MQLPAPSRSVSFSSFVSPMATCITYSDYSHSEGIVVLHYLWAQKLVTKNSGPRYSCKYGSLSPSPQQKMTFGPLVARYGLLCLSDKGEWSIILADVKIKIAKIKTKGIFAKICTCKNFPLYSIYMRFWITISTLWNIPGEQYIPQLHAGLV